MYVIYGEKLTKPEVKKIADFEEHADALEFKNAVENNSKKIPIKCWVIKE